MAIDKEKVLASVKEYREAIRYAEEKDKTLRSDDKEIFNGTVTIKHLDGTILILEHAFIDEDVANHEDYLIAFTEHHGWFVYELSEVDCKFDKY